RRISGGDRVRWYVLRHDGPGSHDGAVADADPRQKDDPSSDPNVVADGWGPRRRLPLLSDGSVGVGEFVVPVEDEDLGPDRDVPADPAGIQPAACADARPVTQIASDP